jgi:5-methylcytosine-specific restriction endonuclease McrA
MAINLIRKKIYSIAEIEAILKEIVLSNLEKEKFQQKVSLDGDTISALSDRYKTFFVKGYTCASCGLQGSYFALERHETDKSYHLNLYAVLNGSQERLMTKDHIIPKSKGGKNSLENYQTMCCVCNRKKADSVDLVVDIPVDI